MSESADQKAWDTNLGYRKGVSDSIGKAREVIEIVAQRLEMRRPDETASEAQLLAMLAGVSIAIAEMTKLVVPDVVQ